MFYIILFDVISNNPNVIKHNAIPRSNKNNVTGTYPIIATTNYYTKHNKLGRTTGWSNKNKISVYHLALGQGSLTEAKFDD